MLQDKMQKTTWKCYQPGCGASTTMTSPWCGTCGKHYKADKGKAKGKGKDNGGRVTQDRAEEADKSLRMQLESLGC